jgi:hypothetical protein
MDDKMGLNFSVLSQKECLYLYLIIKRVRVPWFGSSVSVKLIDLKENPLDVAANEYNSYNIYSN